MATFKLNIDSILQGESSTDVLVSLIHHLQNILDDESVSLGADEHLDLTFNLNYCDEINN